MPQLQGQTLHAEAKVVHPGHASLTLAKVRLKLV